MSGFRARRGKRRRALLLIAALAVPTAIGYPSAHGQPNPAQQCRAANPAAQAILPVVQSNVQRFLGRHPRSITPGVSLAVVSSSPNNPSAPSIAIINCGVTAVDGSTPTTSDTVYELGSETKAFTAAALAELSLRGVVQLDDTLQAFLPQPYVAPKSSCGNANASPITLQELATHNSGLQENPKNLTWSQTNPQGHANTAARISTSLSPPGGSSRATRCAARPARPTCTPTGASRCLAQFCPTATRRLGRVYRTSPNSSATW